MYLIYMSFLTWPMWVAPLPKAAPTQRPSCDDKCIFWCAKRRKLNEYTQNLLVEPWKLSASLIDTQNQCLDEYDEIISTLNRKISMRDKCIDDHKKNINSMSKQIQCKSNIIRKKNIEITNVKQSYKSLQDAMEELNIRLATVESDTEEKVQHYKNLIKGLEKTAGNAEESSAYLRRIQKMLIDYQYGEICEDSEKRTDRVCVICMDNHANIMMKPCNHLEYCYSCSVEAFSLTPQQFLQSNDINVSSNCPRCKVAIDQISYVYT